MSNSNEIKTASSDPAFAVTAKGVVQRYLDPKENRERTILNRVNFQLRPNELCSVVGPSGCGKSTFLRLVLGAEREKEGTLRVFGKPSGPPDRTRGIVYQKYSLFPYMTVLDNITFGLELQAFNTLSIMFPARFRLHRQFRQKAMDYLEQVGLVEHAYKFPFQLSGGQQQRVAIAQTLITSPQIILMDEPFGALDPGNRERLQLWLMEIQQKEKCTIFFVTHDLEEAVFISSRLVVLSQFYSVNGQKQEGAKIVADLDVRDQKKDDKMTAVIELVRDLGFDKNKFQDVSEFALTHPDAVPA